MPEIERKFLVEEDPPQIGGRAERIDQGYLAIDGDGTEVRVRRRAGRFRLTVKSPDAGRVRVEEELPIDEPRFERLWPLTDGRRIEKERSLVELPDGHTAELDVYRGRLAGLRVVEVEFDSEQDSDRFQPPDWFGPEVTDDQRYRNRVLAVEGAPRD